VAKRKYFKSTPDGSEKSKAAGDTAVTAAAANRQRYLGTLPAGKMGRKPTKGGSYDDRK